MALNCARFDTGYLEPLEGRLQDLIDLNSAGIEDFDQLSQKRQIYLLQDEATRH